MLVVTRNQIIIKHFESGFLSAKGDISMDHLKLFLSKLRTEGKINSLIFNISQTQISASDKTEISQCSVICGSEAYTFNKSQLYINDKIVEMAAAEEVAALSKENGALIAPGEFVEKLLGKENPISLAQFNEIEQDDTYFCNVFSEIVRHNQRNEIVSNFHILCSPLRKILETKITEQANRYTRIMTWLVSSSFFAIIAGYGIVYLYDFNAFLAGAVSCISLIVSVNSFLNLKKTIWCRDTCHGNLMMVERA
jgi:hypothetical protein